jgi:hypothetical protein
MTGSPSGGGGSSSGGGNVTPEQALAGACPMMMGSGSGEAPECTGIDEYTACVQDMCGLNDCLDGDCSDLLGCYQDADDPCMADCTPSDECMTCLTELGSCALNNCFDLVMCGTIEEGGACDQLSECCAGLDANDPMKFGCDAAAMLSTAGGDQACMSALEAFCP